MDKVGFYEESPGVKSNGRLNSSIIIYSGILFTFICLFINRVEFMYVGPALVTTGFLKKVLGKFAEK